MALRGFDQFKIENLSVQIMGEQTGNQQNTALG